MDAFKTRWHQWAERFAALPRREKLMVAGAALAVILFGGHSFWIEPALLQKARLEKTIAQQRSEQQQLQAQIAALAQGDDPDAPQRAVLDRLHKELAETEREIRGFDRVLVTPAQASQLLQTLLARHRGLSLVSLTTLPPRPLLPPRPVQDDGKTAAKKPAAPDSNIYKHGIEIKVAGTYHDLLAYVDALESTPQKLLWGGMRLTVQHYPVSELTLTIYTLSLEETWLAV